LLVLLLPQWKPKSAEQAPSDLAELVQQMLQEQPSSCRAAATGVSGGGGSSNSSSREITALVDEPWPHQLALSALRSAEAAVKAAKDAKAAAASSSSSSSSGGDAQVKEAKQAAEEKLEAAELEVEKAKVWVLSCSSSQELAAFFNLPSNVMQKFRPFGM
jgi:hypothetical protein